MNSRDSKIKNYLSLFLLLNIFFGLFHFSQAQTLIQQDYQFFQNADNVQPGTSLANENNAATITSTSSPIRLRTNVTASSSNLATSSQAFKIQYRRSTTTTETGWATSTDSTASVNYDRALALAVDSSSVYIGGSIYAGTGRRWRLEKRNLQNGALVTGFGSNGFVTSTNDINEGGGIALGTSTLFTISDSVAAVRGDLEQRDLTTGALITGFGSGGKVTINFADMNDIALDDSAVYVVGGNTGVLGAWRIEKRSRDTGNLITAFDGDGIATSSATIAESIAVDTVSSVMYVGGKGNTEWRVEKRNLSDGSLVSAFGSNGVVTSTTGSNDWVEDIAISDSALYVAGRVSTIQWQIEKRDLITGALVSGFGTNGVLSVGLNNLNETIYSIALDSTGIYSVGVNDADCGKDCYIDRIRIDKRNLISGDLIAGFGTNGVIEISGSGAATAVNRYDEVVVSPPWIYVAGALDFDGVSAEEWRIEKRHSLTGATSTEDSPSSLSDKPGLWSNIGSLDWGSSPLGGDGINSSWANQTYESVFALGSHNNKLYAGLGINTGDAEVWEYNTSTWSQVGGDGLNSSWASSTYESVRSFVSHNNKLYAGLGGDAGDAEVWEYNTSTWTKVGGSGVSSSWPGSTYERVMTLISYDNKLYAGLGVTGGSGDDDAEVWEYSTTSTWTKIGGDGVNSSWLSDFNNYGRVSALISYNNKLYAGIGDASGDAEVWEYSTSTTTWTKIGGDSVNSSWSSGSNVESLTVYNGNLYAGRIGWAQVWKYNGSSWTQIGGDGLNNSWAASTYEDVYSLIPFGGKLYAGLGSSLNDDELWEYNGESWAKVGGDGIGWGPANEYVSSLVAYNNKLYVGLGRYSVAGSAEVWSTDLPRWKFFNNTSTASTTAIASTLLSSSNVGETYEEKNPTLANPNAIPVGQEGEWDFALDPANATTTTYYFRMVKSNDASLNSYTNYPALIVSTGTPPSTTLTQRNYRWYLNQDSLLPGGAKESLNTAIDNVSLRDLNRLRMDILVSGANLASAAKSFKLQFKTLGAGCAAAESWTDLGTPASTTVWRGFNNQSVADNATLDNVLLDTANIAGTYEEQNNTPNNPNGANVGQAIEYDWVIENNDAAKNVTYCFRMVEPDDTELNGYTNYPQLMTAVRILGPSLTTATEGVSGGGGGTPTIGGTIQGGSEATEPTEGGSGGGEPTGGGTGQGSGTGPASYLDLLSKNFAGLLIIFNNLFSLLR